MHKNACNILLTISYDGTNYGGWQKQPNSITIQEKLETALSRVFNKSISVLGASRTDAGVHALGQKACFFTDNLLIPIDKLPFVINSFLPRDITITSASIAPIDFHPRFDALKKTYLYHIYNNSFPNPLLRNYAWHVRYPLDVSVMKTAAEHFLGKHDFSAFCSANGNAKTFTRSIFDIEVFTNSPSVFISVTGDGFLYNMVRIITGTLMYVGIGKTKPCAIPFIIEEKERALAGITAPANGLTLMDIKYKKM